MARSERSTTARRSPISPGPAAGDVFAKAEELSITVHGTTAITTCLQEMHIVFDENLPPFPVQEAVTRVWEETAEGWRLAHLHQAKRMPPG